jgi:hypothetical protein
MKHGNKRRLAVSQEGLHAIEKWPPAPKHLGEAEVAAWKRIGTAVMSARSIAECDLPLCERLAQIRARVDVALVTPNLKPSALAALLRLEVEVLSKAGLSPAGRATVGQLATARKASHLDEFMPEDGYGR